MDHLACKKLLYGFSISLIFVLSVSTASAVDMEKLKPAPSDIEKTIKKYEYLKEKTDLDKVQEIIKQDNTPPPATSRQSPDIGPEPRTPKEKYLFYLFSKSVPTVTIDSIFKQSKRLEGINFFGVLRGIDKDRKVLSKIQEIKSFQNTNDGITVKINPLIFRLTKAEIVPAFVYALCPPKDAFRSDDCEFKMLLYGDLTLIGALERMGDKDPDLEKVYIGLKDL